MRSFRHLLGWFSFLAVLLSGAAVIPLVLAIALDGLVALVLAEAVRRHSRSGRGAARLTESV